ncbi:hypothetical protein SDC9_176651 [bioreactor metagenome]|uniref:Uncharacterized protein n=1 Tax=bioreactor metagenome TaxID=1076179 RepID=A0A645GSE5_9ZZZZ
MGDGVFHQAGDVLVQAAPQGHVDQLQAAADAQHRLARLHELVQQFHLVGVTHPVAGPFGLEGFLAVAQGREVGAALQHQAVEGAHVVGQAHVAALHGAVLDDGGHHEHQHVPGHDPVGHGLLQVLQGLAQQADALGLGMVKAGGNADLDGALLRGAVFGDAGRGNELIKRFAVPGHDAAFE